MSDEQAELLSKLEQHGAIIKRAKSGRLHTLDLKPLASSLSNDDVAELSLLTDLRHLELDGSPIDDAAVPPLLQLAKLNHLSLQQTNVSDACVETLQQMQWLKFLMLSGTRVGKDGLAELRRAMIGTRIVHLG